MSSSDILSRLFTIIDSRKTADAKQSYVASLFARGNDKIAQKVGEEAVETVLAAASGKKEAIIYESADLLFHLMVLWSAHGIIPQEILAELEHREGTSGHDEKASRT